MSDKIEPVYYSEHHFFSESDKAVLNDIFSFAADYPCITDESEHEINKLMRNRLEQCIIALNSAKINKDQLLSYLIGWFMVDVHDIEHHHQFSRFLSKLFTEED